MDMGRLATSSLLWLVLAANIMQPVYSQFCNMCGTLGSPRNVNLEIPFLQIEDQETLTCSEFADFASSNVGDQTGICDFVQAHGNYCGCTQPQVDFNLCPLCPNDGTPQNLQAMTVFEETCQELHQYLRFLPAELCATERVQTIQLADAFCGCPGATQACHMCSDDTNTLAFPNRAIPFVDPEVGVSGLTTPQFSTCQEIADSSFLLTTAASCNQIQVHDNYCGCSDAAGPANACSLCPDGSVPEDGFRDIPAFGMTCAELDVFISYFDADQCAAGAAARYQLFDYYCGCPNSEPHCPICVNSSSADMANPDAIVPFLGVFGNDNPTCLFLATIGSIVDLDTNGCAIIQAQGDFCGCDGASVPNEGHGCTYCDSGLPPNNGDLLTQWGDTCSELARYMSFLPQEECETERVKLLKQTDLECGCPEATAECPLCDNGTFDIAFADRNVPFVSGGSSGAGTCQDVINFLIINDDTLDGECEDYTIYGGYCGCANTSPPNECTFCPGGEPPPNGDLAVAGGLYTCDELNDFVSHQTAGQCAQDDQMEFLRSFAFNCGCPNTEPACTLCPDGSDPINGNDVLDATGQTCNGFATVIAEFTAGRCESDANLIALAAATCNCPGADWPQCEVQQNAELCTLELLESTDEDCPCYAFCDGEFVTCQPPVGGVLATDDCPGTKVSGCNMAGVIAVSNTDSPSAAVSNYYSSRAGIMVALVTSFFFFFSLKI